MKFRIRATTIAAVAFAVCGANAAAAAGLEQEFARICMPAFTGAEAAANARAAGYVAAPEEIKRRMRGFPSDGNILWRTVEGEITTFLTATQFEGSSADFREPLMVQMCVMTRTPVEADLDVKLQGLLGVGAKQTLGRRKSYIYEQTADGRVRVDPRKGHLTDMAWAKKLRMASVLKQDDAIGIIQLAPRQLTDEERGQLVRRMKPR